MAETIGEFLIKLGLDANNIDRQLNSVIDNVRGGLSNLMSGVVAPALGALAGGEFINSIAEEANEVERLSKSMNMSMEDASAWTAAMANMGVEAGDVRDMFRDFADWMVDIDANDSGPLKDGIEQGLIPSVRDMNGEMKNAQDYVLEFADALQKLDPQTAAGLANQIGLSDRDIASFVEQGGDAIRKQLELAKEIGTYTKEDAAAAREYTMSITVLTHSLKMAALPIFRAIVPILTNIAKGFRELIKQAEPAINQFGQIINTVYTQVSTGVAQALEILSEHITALIPLLAGIVGKQLVGVFALLAENIQRTIVKARAFILSPWGIVLTALLGIGIAIEEFIKWLNGGESVLSGFFEKLFGSAENAQSILNNVYDTFMDIVSGFGEAIEELAPHFEELWNALTNLFSAITGGGGFELFSDIFETVVDVIISAIGIIISIVASLIQFFADNSSAIVSIFASIIDVITALVDIVTAAVDVINTAISSAIEIITALGDNTTSVGEAVSAAFNAMGNAFSSFVSAVVSGAGSIISAIGNILSKLAELASNSLLGRILGSVGGSISAAFAGGGGNTDNSSTITTTNSNNTNNNYYYPGGWGAFPPANMDIGSQF